MGCADYETDSKGQGLGDALPEMQRIHDGGAALHTHESTALCPLPELRILDRPRRFTPILS
jgi:hypothetical protein